MKLLLHDFAGHPFPAQLARALAARGVDVDHAFCAGVTTGVGDLVKRVGDPPTLQFTSISDQPFERYSPARRLLSESRYGRRLARHVRETRPHVILSGNTPLTSQAYLWRAAQQEHAARVYWVQDFLGQGTRRVLSARSRVLGATVGAEFENLETRLLRSADAAIVIAEDFTTELARRSVRVPTAVIENWAPLDEISIVDKNNPWSRAQGLNDRRVALYSGTLGLKHDPEHLVAVARAMRGTASSNGRCAVPVMMTGAVDRHHRPLENPGCQARRCRCPNVKRSVSR